MLRTPRRRAAIAAWPWALGLALFGWPAPGARAADEPTRDPAVVRSSLAFKDRPVRPSTRRADGDGPAPAAPNWWLGPAGVAAALAVVGGVSLASRRFGLNLNLGAARDLGALGVVGHARLSPKHSVYLVRVGGRVLILGAGAGGSPTTLGEVTDPAELARLVPARPGRAAGAGASSRPATIVTTGFDRRIGDDE